MLWDEGPPACFVSSLLCFEPATVAGAFFASKAYNNGNDGGHSELEVLKAGLRTPCGVTALISSGCLGLQGNPCSRLQGVRCTWPPLGRGLSQPAGEEKNTARHEQAGRSQRLPYESLGLFIIFGQPRSWESKTIPSSENWLSNDVLIPGERLKGSRKPSSAMGATLLFLDHHPGLDKLSHSVQASL